MKKLLYILPLLVMGCGKSDNHSSSTVKVDIQDIEINVTDELNVDMITQFKTATLESTTTIDLSTGYTPSYTDVIESLATTPTTDRYTNDQVIGFKDYENHEQDVYINIDAVCPEFVSSVSGIKFGNNGEGVELKITFDISAFADVCENISWDYPSLYIHFEDGFVLGNSDGASYVLFDGDNTNQKQHAFTTRIMGYNGDISTDKLNNFKFNVQCILGNGTTPEVKIKSFTANGGSLNLDDKFTIKIESEALEVHDATLTMSNIEMLVDDVTLSEKIIIDQVSNKLDCVVFKEGTNLVDFSIDCFEIPEGLNSATEEFVMVYVPADRFELSGYNNEVMSPNADGMYEITFSTDHLIGTGIVSEYAYLDAIYPSLFPVSDSSIEFDPEIKVVGTTIYLNGEMTLSDYNLFVDRVLYPQDLTFSIAADDIEVDYAEAKN